MFIFWSGQITDQVMSGIPVRVYEPESSIQQTNRPVLLYLHGGGWAFLSIGKLFLIVFFSTSSTWITVMFNFKHRIDFVDNYDHLCQKLAKDADIVVISVEWVHVIFKKSSTSLKIKKANSMNMIWFTYIFLYFSYRLSPQNPYPAGLDDVTSIVMHVSENSRSLGIDPGRIAVGGDSAGGNLAAAVQLRPETRGKLSMLLLLVPVLQGVNMKTIGFTENVEYLHNSINNPGQVVYFFHYMSLDHSLFNAFRNNLHTSAEFKKGKYRFLFDQRKYLPAEYIRSAKLKQIGNDIEQVGNETLFNELKDKLLTPTIFPMMASDEELSTFPFTYVMAAGYDLIRDDAIMFAERLRHLNVEVQLSHFPDGFHNDLIMFDGPFKTDVGVRTVMDMVKVLKKL